MQLKIKSQDGKQTVDKRQFIFNGGTSKRYHTADTLRQQSIADHSFGVAWFCELLTDGSASKNLIMAALAHDLAEHQVGDIPSPAKRALNLGDQFEELENGFLEAADLSRYFEDLPPREVAVLKLADCLEGLMFCLKERRLGNRNVDIIFQRFTEYVQKTVDENINTAPFICGRAAELLASIGEEYAHVIS